MTSTESITRAERLAGLLERGYTVFVPEERAIMAQALRAVIEGANNDNWQIIYSDEGATETYECFKPGQQVFFDVLQVNED